MNSPTRLGAVGGAPPCFFFSDLGKDPGEFIAKEFQLVFHVAQILIFLGQFVLESPDLVMKFVPLPFDNFNFSLGGVNDGFFLAETCSDRGASSRFAR